MVSFWKAQLSHSVRQLQAALSGASPTLLANEHEVYCQLCCVTDCLQRIYKGSEAFYTLLVEDVSIPIPAICQVRGRPRLKEQVTVEGWLTRSHARLVPCMAAVKHKSHRHAGY